MYTTIKIRKKHLMSQKSSHQTSQQQQQSSETIESREEQEGTQHEIRMKWMERVLTSPSNPIKSRNIAPRPGKVKPIKADGEEVKKVYVRPKPSRRRRKSILIEQKDVDRVGQLRKKEKENQNAMFFEEKRNSNGIENQFLRKLSSTLIEIPENGRKQEEEARREENRHAISNKSVSLNDLLDDIDDEETKNDDNDDEERNARSFIRGTSLDSIIQQSQQHHVKHGQSQQPILKLRKEQDKKQRNIIRGTSLDNVIEDKQEEGTKNSSSLSSGRGSPDSVLLCNFEVDRDKHDRILSDHDDDNFKKSNSFTSSSYSYSVSPSACNAMSRRGTSLDSVIPVSIVSMGGNLSKASSAMSEKVRTECQQQKRIGYTV